MNETIADIVCELRKGSVYNEGGCIYLHDIADRIEAACKHEADGYKDRIKLWSDRADELRRKCDEQYAELKRERGATCEKSSQVGDNAEMRKAIAKCVNLITEFGNAEIVKTPLDVIIDIEAILKAALDAPPRPYDVMSLKAAKKVWFAKEIIPRLNGDLPLGKEVPFEEWFVSSSEQ